MLRTVGLIPPMTRDKPAVRPFDWRRFSGRRRTALHAAEVHDAHSSQRALGDALEGLATMALDMTVIRHEDLLIEPRHAGEDEARHLISSVDEFLYADLRLIVPLSTRTV